MILGGYDIPTAVWSAIYNYVRSVGHVPFPFVAGNSCWKLAFYLGICGCESNFVDQCGDGTYGVRSGTGATCCTYYRCLDTVACPGGVTAWDRARAHTHRGQTCIDVQAAGGACLSHGWYQLYVCGQGEPYVCDPEKLHDPVIHMSIALPNISGPINSYWNDSNIEQSCRTCTQYAGHPGIVGDYDSRVTNIWNATQRIQPDLYAYLLGNVPPPSGLVVTLYEHTQYQGRWLSLTADIPDFIPLGFNDIASSIKIEGAVTTPSVTLYQHNYYMGASITFNASDPDFNKRMMTDTLSWNDQASSLKMIAPAPQPSFPPGPLPPFPVPKQTLGSSPLPPIPGLCTNPLPLFPY